MSTDLLAAVKAYPLPFATLVGVEMTEASKDRIAATLHVREDLCTAGSILHGGAIMALADTVGAVTTALNLTPGAGTTTIESKTNFLAPAPAGETVTAVSEPIHRGKRTMVWQTRITRGDGKLVALVTQSQMVLGG